MIAGFAAFRDQVCSVEQDPGVHRDRDDAAVQGAPARSRALVSGGGKEADTVEIGPASAGGQAPVAILAHHRGLARLPHHLRLIPPSAQYAAHCTSI